jgi:hypothetical protein
VVPIVSIPANIEAGVVPYRDLFPRPETYQHIGVRLDRFDPIGSNKARFYPSMKNALPRC